ncbi:MAG: addiction module protein [Pseudomonadota bacterium]|nr:addiction module protein [Pseudomonadota bacterium]MDP1905814.1 addiction module protein [Pseudomonadota bacterium]MDP2354044.1 addiction module protein [Pseudomonadota bacterium]
MNIQIEAMVEQAKALTAEERVALLDALNELINPPDAAWQEAWAKESEDRLTAYEQGRIEAEDFDVVMARLRKEYLPK